MDEFEKDLNEQQTPLPTDAPAQDAEAAQPSPDAAVEADEAVEAGEAVEADAADAVVETGEAAEADEADAAVEAGEAAEAALENDAAADEGPQTQEDALVQELEGIRDLLQQELDNAQDGELIQELDDVAEEGAQDAPEEIPEEERCQCCGERRRDLSFGEDYPYCDECRNLMKAAPFKLSSVLCLLLMLVVAGASLVFCTRSIADYNTLMQAETEYANRCIVDAEATYYNYVSQCQYSDSYSRSAVKNLIRIFSYMGYIGDANDLITRFFTDEQLKLPWNKRYAAIAKEYTELSQASNKVSELLQDVLYTEASFDYEEKAAALDALANPGEDGTPGLDPLFVEYYRYVLMNLSKQKSDEEMLAQLKMLEEMDDGTHLWLYMTNILSLAAKMGDVETAQAYYDKCMAINIQESAAYTALANAYRFCETPDPDKILEIAAKAEENMSASAVPTYLVDRAVAYLFKEDTKSAMDAMEAYINSGNETGQTPYTVQSCNLYALCCVLSDDEDGYKEMQDVFASAGMDVSDLVKQFKEGKLTLNEVLSDNGGDI